MATFFLSSGDFLGFWFLRLTFRHSTPSASSTEVAPAAIIRMTALLKLFAYAAKNPCNASGVDTNCVNPVAPA